MIIEPHKIPPEGVTLCEEIAPQALALEVECATFCESIKVAAVVSKAYNVVSVKLKIDAPIRAFCSRCLKEYTIDFKKNLSLNYPVEKTDSAIDLNPEIREEILLNFPLKPLCTLECKGLCPHCGRDLNEGGCSCGTT
jgi:uncharacterized protein